MIFKKDEDEDSAQSQEMVGQPQEPRKERQMSDNGEVTVVGVGARLDGNVVSAGSLRIDGQVKGQINADGDVVLSAQSSVEATINAANVAVAGRFKGDLVVKGKVELARGGRVDGNINAKALVIQEGGIFNGQSQMDGGGAPAQASGAPAQAPAKPADTGKPQA